MAQRTHGMSRKSNGLSTKEYKAWCGMKSRCTNPHNQYYHRYGGRGITFCSRWFSFEAFLEDVGYAPTPQHTLGRIDNDRDYAPGNVEWQTQSEQNLGKRNLNTPKPRLESVGVELVLSLRADGKTTRQIAEQTGLSKSYVWYILKNEARQD